jgi:spore germination protein KA
MVRYICPRKLTKKAGTKKTNNAERIIDNGLTYDLKDNIELFKKLFAEDDTFIIRKIENRNNPDIHCCLMFLDGMIDVNIINENIIKPINTYASEIKGNLSKVLSDQIIQSNDINTSEDINKLLESILYGDTLLFVQGHKNALIINTKGWNTRNIDEPDLEKVSVGPKEGFTESIIQNLSMVRRRILTNDLKFKFRTFGSRTRTKVCICYIKGIVHESILAELERRLDSVDLDGILDSEYIREFITDAPLSLFNTIYRTERPDTVAGNLLEGRIALIVDGTPVALTLPCMFIENIQVNQDYYASFQTSSFNRILRIIALLITTCLPAIYLSMITYHHEMIPTPLLVSIYSARQGVPFPSIIELLGLIIIFDIIREAGTRMPSSVGQAFSIVGALVLGQAAVEAKFISAPIVIIIAFAGITSLMLPKMQNTIILARLALIFISAILGLYGFLFLFTAIMVHAFSLRSFGVPFMSHIMTFDKEDIKDTVIRMPWWYMNFRPKMVAKDQKRKTKEDNRA